MNILFTPYRYYKAAPTTYLIQYRNGRIVRQGRGISLFYFAANTTLIAIPTSSVDLPFMFAENTADFQEITLQGQVVYRISDPERLSTMVNFALNRDGSGYLSDDPQKLDNQILNQVQIAIRAEIQKMGLSATLQAGDELGQRVNQRFIESANLQRLGIEIIDMAIIAIKPIPETGRALEAKMREQILQQADEAIYLRRNAAIENERAIKENELQTEIAITEMQQQVQEGEMEAKRQRAEKKRQIEMENLQGAIDQEQQRQQLVEQRAENSRTEADSKAYALDKIMEILSGIEPKILESLTSSAMNPDQLIARSFQGLAERADKIGELNISPDLLGQLLGRKAS